MPPIDKQKSIFFKFLSIFSVVRIYNILIIVLAQYLTSIFILSDKKLFDVIFDFNLFLLIICSSLSIASGYIINNFYDQKKDETKTDDVGLAIKNGLRVKFVEGEENNKKITTMNDIINNKIGQNNQSEFRTGIGYDVHAFDKGKAIILCGIKIPYKFSLMGHSDADVSMHAITDALYGAIAEGDIGTWFSPNEPKWKNKNSEIFLTHSKNLLNNRGFKISNIDCTIVCEEPKINPHVEEMKENIARILDIERQQVSIKATTSEKLGFIGRQEGIASHAIATVIKN